MKPLGAKTHALELDWSHAEYPGQGRARRRPPGSPAQSGGGWPVTAGVPADQAHSGGSAANHRRGAEPSSAEVRRSLASAPGDQAGSGGPRKIIVPDASALVVALVDDGPAGDAVRAKLRGNELAAPALIDVEIASVVRKHLLNGGLTEHRAALAIADLIDLPMERIPHAPLLRRVWELIANVTPYDAVYVALAETLSATLLTGDGRLARAPGLRCHVEVMTEPVSGG
ncbi:type II toxin-antitoxin system VapC family toxin [Micromonospora sp. CPCC 206061]